MESAVGYVRVSTLEQSTEGVSIAAQKARIAAWCEAHDYELAAVHADEGLSGSRADNRGGLQKALAEVCQRKVALVVYSLSRLSRSIKDTITIAERLEKSGADLVSLSERIDTTSASGRMVFRMLAVLNEFERDQISERTKLAMKHKQRLSELVGEVPYGFTLQPDGRSLAPDPAEQAVLSTILKLRQKGLSYRRIAAELDGRAIPSKQGKRWNFSTIRRIVHRHGSGPCLNSAPGSQRPARSLSST